MKKGRALEFSTRPLVYFRHVTDAPRGDDERAVR
jgi:hypothetical protein